MYIDASSEFCQGGNMIFPEVVFGKLLVDFFKRSL